MQKQETSLVLPPEGFVRLPVVVKVMGIGKTTWWVGVKKGRFPKPVKLGPRTSAWRVEDIRALFAKLKAESGDERAEDAANGK